jgi:Carbon monoxide dehydrogenase subunit G (CoxG)/ATP dependent DNA ligase domain
MQLQNEFTVPAPVSEVWKTLLDVQRITPCLPGATVDRVEGDEVAGQLRVKVGPIMVSYAGTARFVATDETAHRFSDPAWLFEPKFDGECCLAFRSGQQLRLMTRNRQQVTSTYPEIADALRAQEASGFIVDGKIVAFVGDRTSFSRLQRRLGVSGSVALVIERAGLDKQPGVVAD